MKVENIKIHTPRNWDELQEGKNKNDSYPVAEGKLVLVKCSSVEAFMMSLIDGTVQKVPSVTASEIAAIKKEDEERQSGHESLSKGYKPLTPQEIERRELHIQYVKENYHPLTREKLSGWKEEKTWLSDNGYFEIEGTLIKAESEEQAKEKYLENI